jgi:DNA polymerase-3 subunit epsilon
MREIILDTETTGLDPNSGHRIIEIGVVEMYDKVLTGRKFHHYINPQRNVPDEAYRIHGISTEFLLDKPLFSQIAEEMMQFFQSGILVIHNAPFDTKFLNYELTLLGLPSIDQQNVIDTLPMARKMFPGAKVNLDALCNRFNIDNSNRAFHGALKDAKLLADIYVELCGGRQAKFQGFEAKNIIDAEHVEMKKEYRKTRIIEPTTEEKMEHQKLLEKLLIN